MDTKDDFKMGNKMISQKWHIFVKCKNPIRYRELEPVSALDTEQALLLARNKATELLGEEGSGWTEVHVHIMNTTYPRTKT